MIHRFELAQIKTRCQGKTLKKKVFSRTRNGNVILFCTKFPCQIEIEPCAKWGPKFNIDYNCDIKIQICTNEGLLGSSPGRSKFNICYDRQ